MDNKDLLENYFENTIIPQLYIDKDLILRKFTPPAMKQFTLSYADIGRSIQDLINNIRYPSIAENIEEVINSKKIIEKEIQTTDLRWFQMNILPFVIRKENVTDGVIVTFVDITKRIKALTDLQKLYTEHATFSYSVAHDISQPLSTLNMLSSALKDAYTKKDDDFFQMSLELLDRSVLNITKIAQSLEKVTSHKQDISGNEERVNIEDIWEDVTLALKEEIYKGRARIITHFDTSEIMFSRINLRSIIYNLLYNSIKYRKNNEILNIKASTEKIVGYIVFTITDNGIGIDKLDHQKIFTEFTRLNLKGPGKGIGLYLVSTMLQNNHGKIEVESTLDEGATFRVFFPVD